MMVHDWKLTKLEDARDRASLGNKACGLGDLKRFGSRVPEGWVLPRQAGERILAEAGVLEELTAALAELSLDNAAGTADRIQAMTGTLAVPVTLVERLADVLESGRRYAVRSSATLEDLAGASFAGQYDSYLDVPPEAVPARILDCLRSQWREPVLRYGLDHGLAPSASGMAVLIQEMVAADLAGVLFSVDPNTGADTEVVMEAVPGLGDALVSGRATPHRYRYNWFHDKVSLTEDSKLLSRGQVRILGRSALKIQKLYGFPVDIEFAAAGGRNYALQVRPVTRIEYNGMNDQWSTADFKDGGVSATVGRPLMLSLYEYVWERELKRFLLESGILKEAELRPLSQVRFGRMYWNLSVVKEAMAKVPGFREREFDQELGIQPNYEGDGRVTRWTPASAGRLLRIALAQRRIVGERRRRNETLKAELLEGCDSVSAALPDLEGKALKAAWIRLVRDLYLKSEGIYFWQIFINTIHQSIQRDSILKYTEPSGYYDLIGGLTNVSHLRPFYELWDLSRAVRRDPQALAWWLETSPADLVQAVREPQADRHPVSGFRRILEKYGYHSDRELDIAWPSYAEDPTPLIASFREVLALDERYSPDQSKLKVHEQHLAALDQIGRLHGSKVRDKVAEKVEAIRTMLWWREEFRDISTRCYHLIRLYTLKLAELLVREGVLPDAGDIWFLSMSDLLDLLDERLSAPNAQRRIRRNRDYYESFRNFSSDNEIGEGFIPPEAAPAGDVFLAGTPGSSGRITGTARVVSGLEEIHRLQPGDILVTRFTDTGWTSKFALLAGVITEYGGALCHAAIISREYGIPCIVSVRGAMAGIADGDRITMDGATGEIRKEMI